MLKYLLFFLLFPSLGNAQILDSLDTYDHKEFENQTLKVFSDNGLIQLQVLKSNLIKVSFSKKDELVKQEVAKPAEAVYVRITQNLESIFMQTDTLLIVISKLDFSIKFQNLREQVYTVNQNISFLNDGLNLQFVIANNELFYNQKHKRLKSKIYAIKKLKSINSSNQYIIYFDNETKGSLDFRNSSTLNLKFYNSAAFEYYFKVNKLFN